MENQFLTGSSDNQSPSEVDLANIRLGILLYLRLNTSQLSERLRWAYVPYGRLVKQAGYGPKGHAQLVTQLHQLQTVYTEKGGNIQTLQAAILAAKGNVSPVLRLSADEQTAQIKWLKQDANWQALNIRLKAPGTLGNTAAADASQSPVLAIIKLALPLINAILGKVFKVKINDPDDPVPVPDDEADVEEPDAPSEPDGSTGTSESSPADDPSGTAGLDGLRRRLHNQHFGSKK